MTQEERDIQKDLDARRLCERECSAAIAVVRGLYIRAVREQSLHGARVPEAPSMHQWRHTIEVSLLHVGAVL